MDSTGATYSILPGVSFRSVSFSSNTSYQKYLDLHNHYAGTMQTDWRGEATAHPGALEFMEKVKPSKCPSCLHHWFA